MTYINQSINQSINHSINQSITQSINAGRNPVQYFWPISRCNICTLVPQNYPKGNPLPIANSNSPFHSPDQSSSLLFFPTLSLPLLPGQTIARICFHCTPRHLF